MFFRVDRSTIWSWLRRNKIAPVGTRKESYRWVNTYPFLELAEAERSARLEPRGRKRNSLKAERLDCP